MNDASNIFCFFNFMFQIRFANCITIYNLQERKSVFDFALAYYFALNHTKWNQQLFILDIGNLEFIVFKKASAKSEIMVSGCSSFFVQISILSFTKLTTSS